MSLKTIVTLGITTLVIITAMSTLAGKKLVKEDGKISAATLPFDKETSKIKYETITFGLG